MRLRFFKVSGDSMRPAFHDGDYVVAWRTRRLKVGDVVAVNHPLYGLIIKRINQIDYSADLPTLRLKGDNRSFSTPSDALGLITVDHVWGKVFWHIKQAKAATTNTISH